MVASATEIIMRELDTIYHAVKIAVKPFDPFIKIPVYQFKLWGRVQVPFLSDRYNKFECIILRNRGYVYFCEKSGIVNEASSLFHQLLKL